MKEAIGIDGKNGNHLWWESLIKEMKNVRCAFDVYKGKREDLVGYGKVWCHIVWDVKLRENFC